MAEQNRFPSRSRPGPGASAVCPAGAGLPDGPRLTSRELSRMESERQLLAWEEYARVFGPVFTLRAEGEPPRVYISDPDAVRALFIGDRTPWDARGTLYFRPVIGAQALPYLIGEEHRAVRLLLAPPLHGVPLRALGPAVDEIVDGVMARLRGRTRPVIRLAHEITLRLIVRVCFGPLPEARREECAALLIDVMDLMYEPGTARDADRGQLLDRMDPLLARLQQIVTEETASARTVPDSSRTDLLFHLATAEPAQPDEQIRGHIMTLLIAGHDTTASALAWALYQLEIHPGIRRRLVRAIDSLGADPAHADIARLPYLGAVCAETLRHGSVVPAGLARVVPEDFDWDGHHIPAGTELVPAIHLVHHRPDLYPAPDRFDPGRFLRHKPSGSRYLPFGTGTRRCPGAELADFELRIALARLLRTPGLRLLGADRGLRRLKNGPTMTIPASLEITLDNSPPATVPEEGESA